MPAHTDTRAAHLRRPRRIEGQVRGLQRTVTEDVYCIDVLAQVAAATWALQSFGLERLASTRPGRVVEAARTGRDEGEAKVQEAAQAIAALVRW